MNKQATSKQYDGQAGCKAVSVYVQPGPHPWNYNQWNMTEYSCVALTGCTLVPARNQTLQWGATVDAYIME